jgi:hypothetical protein
VFPSQAHISDFLRNRKLSWCSSLGNASVGLVRLGEMTSHVSSRLWLIAALGFTACSASVEPIEVAASCPDQPIRGPSQFAAAPEQQLIDDFEHESQSLPRLGGRDGAWILGSDSTGAHLEANVSDKCAGRGQRAGHFVGNGFSNWAANWTAVLRSQPGGTAVAYDATPYGGISFWAAVSSDSPAPFSLPVGVTSMDVAWNGGICTKCMDYYRSTVSVDRAWRRFELRFSDLAQTGMGEPQVALRLEKFVGVIFWPQADFDVWVDDVRFEQ